MPEQYVSVRVVDSHGNRSAPSPPVKVQPVPLAASLEQRLQDLEARIAVLESKVP